MSEPLRPMNLGEILDRTFQIYRSRFLVFVGIAVLPALVMAVIELANQLWWKMTPAPYGRRILLWYTPQSLLYGLVLTQGRVLFSLFLWPVFTFATSKFVFGEPFGLIALLSECFKRWKRWIGLTAANWSLQLLAPELVVAGLLIGTVALMFDVFQMDRDDPLGLGRWMFVASLVSVFAAFQWAGSMIALSAPAWAIENIRVGPAIRRAFRLSRGSRWRIVIVRVLPPIISWALTTLISVSIVLALSFVFGRSNQWWSRHRDLLGSIAILTQGAVATLVGPICPIALTLIYYDQRIRKEGFDIENMMHAAGWTTETAQASLPQPEGEILPEAHA